MESKSSAQHFDIVLCDEIDLSRLLENPKVELWSMKPAEATRRLNWLLSQFLQNNYWEQAPAATLVALELSGIATAAKKLSTRLKIKESSRWSQDKKAACVARIEYEAKIASDSTNRLQEIIRDIQLLEAWAKVAKSKVLKSARATHKRHSGEQAINGLLSDLISLWSDATGTFPTVWAAVTSQSRFITFAIDTKALLERKLTEQDLTLDKTVQDKLNRLTPDTIRVRCERFMRDNHEYKKK